MRVTLNDIANRAGVSRGTVDRFLHNRNGISEKTANRIREALEELHYTPNKAAQSLVRSHKNLKIAAVYPQWGGYADEFFHEGCEKAREKLNEVGISLEERLYPHSDHNKCLTILEELREQGIHGLAVSGEDSIPMKRLLTLYRQEQIPIVTFNTDIFDCGRLAFVGEHAVRSGRVAGEIASKFLREGDEILIVMGNQEFVGHRERVEGFLRRLEELGIARERSCVIQSFLDYSITYRKVTEVLEQNDKIHYIYMSNRSVTACVAAVKDMDRMGEIRILCHDVSLAKMQLLKEGAVDFTIDQQFQEQVYQALLILRDLLIYQQAPMQEYYYTPIAIVSAENLPNWGENPLA